MLTKMITYWNFGKEYCSLEHSSGNRLPENIFGLQANKKKGEFEISKTFSSTSIKELSKNLNKNQHCFLTLTNNQVLLKATEVSGNDAKIISTAFPNIELEEFYYEILKTSSQQLVALCRKEHVHQIITEYQNEGILIIGFSLSFFSIQNLLSLLKEDELSFSKYEIRKKGNQLLSFGKNTNSEEIDYEIEDLTVSSRYLLPLASLFNYETENSFIRSNTGIKNNDLRKEYKQQVFFKKGMLAGIGILLISLLLNFMFFSGYYAELQELSSQYEEELSQKQAYNLKSQEIVAKEKIVSNIFNNSTSKSSYFLNRIINSKPKSVLLSEFTFQPLLKQIKENESIKLETNKIIITGESKEEISFSAWIKELESMRWIKQVQISDFGYKNAQNSEFTLNLTLEEDEAKH